jgi:hypothetical protein
MLKNHPLLQSKTKDKGRSANASMTKAQMKKVLQNTEKLADALKELNTDYIPELKPAIDRAYTVLTGKIKRPEETKKILESDMLKLENVLPLGELTKIKNDAKYLVDFVKLIV